MDFAFIQQLFHPALLAVGAVALISLCVTLLVSGSLSAHKNIKKKKAATPYVSSKTDWSTTVSNSLFKMKDTVAPKK